ncbi:UNVERIFIED_CONTAM: syntaxin [Sesamum angustifolium]|uniref:Syntaxin n=1 Tax=Sesamum angustifolium TaxID=2727405 RepID=A0AAW2N4L3_9LAMI
MSVIDILTRVDAICKKYDKYDVAQKDSNVSGDDAFGRLYASVESDIESALQVKGLSTEELAARNDLVLALPDRIQAIPDGSAAPPKPSRGWELQLLVQKSNLIRDEGLDMISEGLHTLKNMANDMNEVDKATADLKNTNVRLKDTVNQCVEEMNMIATSDGLSCMMSLVKFFPQPPYDNLSGSEPYIDLATIQLT